MVLVSYTLLALHAATSLALSGENMPSAGCVLVTSQNTDDNDGNDNDNIISENLESGGHDLCSSDLQGCLGVLDPPRCPLKATHLVYSFLPLKDHQGSLTGGEERV